MKCENCGNELQPLAKFCTNCGTPVSSGVDSAAPLSDDPMSHWPQENFSSDINNTRETADIPQPPVAPPANPYQAQNPTYNGQPYGQYPMPGGPVPQPPKKKNGVLAGVLIGVGALIVVIIIVLIVAFAVKGGNPSSSSSGTSVPATSSKDAPQGPIDEPSGLSGDKTAFTIGSLTFQMPAEWEREDSGDTVYFYPSDDYLDILMFQITSGIGGILDSDAAMEAFIGGISGSSDNYVELDFKAHSFDEISGRLHSYTSDMEGENYRFDNFYFVDGDDLILVAYGAPTAEGVDGISMLEMVIPTAASGGPASGGDADSSVEAAAGKTYKDGMYKVGSDLPAGEYVVFPTGSISGYYEVSTDSSGSYGSVLQNDNYDGRRYVTLEDGQYIKIDRSKMMALADAPAVDASKDVLPEGMYRVGVDLPAGEYKVSQKGDIDAYLEVRSDSLASSGYDAIVTNDNFSGDTYITVAEGQYLTVTRAEIHLK